MPLIPRFQVLFLCAMLLPAAFGLAQESAASDPLVIRDDNRTPTWEETLAVFEELAEASEEAHLIEVGKSDVGRPIHAFVLSRSALEFNDLDGLRTLRQSSRLGLLINNAIHPGEPCGVDASVAWIRSLLADNKMRRSVLDVMDIAVIPMYNVGGALNRNCCTRTNQDGPEEYGFRGNARNLDLNRDFIKMDSRNAGAFVDLFQAFSPEVFIDTHTTNGADYPYEMTLISTQPDKAGPIVGSFIRDTMEPALYASMEQRGIPTSPYVYSIGETPEEGIVGFLETPRYSTGYASLFGCIGFTAEAHMLKPFPVRVQATQAFIEIVVDFMRLRSDDLKEVRAAEAARWSAIEKAPVRWERTEAFTALSFEGFESRKEISPVTGELRLKYNRLSRWNKEIPFYNHYAPTVESTIPEYWVIPQAWRHVVERLQRNGVEMEALKNDTTMLLRAGDIWGFSSSSRPYEGHHMNELDSVDWSVVPVRLFAGDWVIPTDQAHLRYLCEVLEPRAHDSFFTWNFFDSAMQQKEHFSGYVFEETAAELLSSDSLLRTSFEQAKANDAELRENARAQLNWLYRASPHYEGTANRYPVYKSTNDRR